MDINKMKYQTGRRNSTLFTVLFVALLAAAAVWWYFVLPKTDVEGLRQIVGVIAQSLAAVLGIMVVASIFAFSKVEDCRMELKKVRSKYVMMLKEGKTFPIDKLKKQMIDAIVASDSVEKRSLLLGKLFNISVLSGVAYGGEEEAVKSLKVELVKTGFSNKAEIENFEDYVKAAIAYEMVFFQFVEDLINSAVYKEYEAGKELVETLSEGFFGDDSVNDNIWTIRGGAETTGPAFKVMIAISCLTVIASFFILPTIIGAEGSFNIYRVIAGIDVTLGAFSFLYVARYIMRVVGGRY